MAELFIKQAKQYSEARPSYPQQLFDFIVSKTPCHEFAWDVGTGSGQAAISLARIYKNVVATGASPKQLEFATKLANVRYQLTPPKISIAEIQQTVGAQLSVDLVIIAQAIHWFDLPTFYQQVKWVLKKPNGVIAAWCYTTPQVKPAVDSVLHRFYTVDSERYLEPTIKLIDQKYETIDFPFEVVDGDRHNGTPLKFKAGKMMYFTYLRSWSSYQTAKRKGVELLTDDLIEDFKKTWNVDGKTQKIATFPVYLRIGKLGSSSDREIKLD